jgi:hypothetical protein
VIAFKIYSFDAANRQFNMSAVPKKKLCWNCEGNVAKDIDNCPYCGVYVHGAEVEEDARWNPSYQPDSTKMEDIPSPLYQVKLEVRENIQK